MNLHASYAKPILFFRFYGFEWVPLLGENVPWVYAAIAFASLGVTFGKFYRTSAAIVGLGYAWVFLQSQSLYLNHVYMQLLYCLLVFVIPANRYWSLDAKHNPGIASNTLPAWCRILLIVQIEVILIWAGIVKINPDWLQLEPLAHWLDTRQHISFFGQLFSQPWAIAFAAYTITAVHLFGAPLLLFKKTRLFILVFYGCFHLLNHFVFNIGVFPWITFFASLICFDPDWPRVFWARIRKQSYAPPPLSGFQTPSINHQWTITALFCLWFVYQNGMPMRNWFYDGWVAWNEQGHRFAWRMKLRSKRGLAVFLVRDPATGERYEVNPDALLVGRQKGKMHCQPDMILQMAHYLRDNYMPQGKPIENAEVYASALCSLNYREPQQLIDTTVDLAKVERTLTGNTWITRLETPLRSAAWDALIN